MSDTTFTYVSGSAGQYDWSTNSNWTPSPVSTNIASPSIVTILNDAPGGAVSVDNYASLTINGLDIASGASLVIAAGDTLTITGAVTGVGSNVGGTVDLTGSGTVLDLTGSSPFAGAAVSFGGGGEQLALYAVYSGSDAAAVTNFLSSDSVDFQFLTSITGETITNGTTIGGVVSGGTLTVNGVGGGPPSSPTSVSFTNYSGATTFTTSADSQGGVILTATCYAAGTRLLTQAGERAVEELREGDLILTQLGDTLVPTPITWVGQLRVDLARHKRPETAAPIRIRRGAFADGVPHRDLLVSPEHCLFADGKLIAAKSLVNGATIVQDFAVPTIQYFHIETTPHAIVLAEGLPAETYLDTGNRAIFDNAGHALLLHPEFHINTALRGWATDACAPLATTAEQIAPVWHRLAARAQALGHTLPQPETTTDAAPRLLLAGRDLAPLAATPHTLTFLLPAGTTEIALASRHGTPTDITPWCNDHRRLGLAVTGIALRGPAGEQRITLDSPAFGPGWHAPEQAEGAAWRWTDGRGILRLPETTGRTVLEIHLGSAMTYRVDPPARGRQAA